VGLRNAHAMEQEALQLMRRQVERLEHYPEVAKRLRAHITETERQAERLQKIMEQHETSPSTLKDLTLQMMGNMAALGNAFAGDEILKNSFANQAFEAFEIAAYKSLIALAEKQGDKRALPLLKASLREEEQMLAWSDRNIQKVTMDYVRREEMEREASH
jgi:ferritin-like metal-binding protein YciE